MDEIHHVPNIWIRFLLHLSEQLKKRHPIVPAMSGALISNAAAQQIIAKPRQEFKQQHQKSTAKQTPPSGVDHTKKHNADDTRSAFSPSSHMKARRITRSDHNQMPSYPKQRREAIKGETENRITNVIMTGFLLQLGQKRCYAPARLAR